MHLAMVRHPSEAFYDEGAPFPSLPVCEHYAGSEKLINKAIELQRTLPLFDVTLDLEDGAPEGRERAHAEMVVELLRGAGGDGHRRGVRVHGIHHPCFEQDLSIVLGGARASLRYLTLPKARSVEDVKAVLPFTGTLPLHVLIETHGALSDAFAIAALEEVEVLDFGLMDFVSAHHGAIPSSAMRSPGQFEHALVRRAKARIAAAALANSTVPSHNVTIDLRDAARVKSDAERAHRELGFLRMWSVHPAQIEPIIEAFRPAEEDVARAAGILLAARDRDWGPIQLEGRLYDRASYRYEWALLQRAYLSGSSIPEGARVAFWPER